MLRVLVFVCTCAAVSGRIIPGDDNELVCGVPQIKPYEMSTNIVGGDAAREGSWPWMVDVLKKRTLGQFTHDCGGTILNTHWIVSAAHCFDDKHDLTISQFSVGGYLAGDLGETTRQTFFAEKIIRHPDYVDSLYPNDIALIKVDGVIEFNDRVSPACLEDQTPTVGTVAYVTGWGAQQTNIYDKRLQQVNVPIVDQEDCANSYKWHRIPITEDMICAGYYEGGKDSCGGDSGGPLVVKDVYTSPTGENTEVWSLAGVVSFGYGCALPEKFGVYADVAHFKTWIEETMKNN